MKTPEQASMNRGDAVIWSAQPHGGYGYILHVPAIVVKQSEKRVQILARLERGGYRRVSVRPQNLIYIGA